MDLRALAGTQTGYLHSRSPKVEDVRRITLRLDGFFSAEGKWFLIPHYAHLLRMFKVMQTLNASPHTWRKWLFTPYFQIYFQDPKFVRSAVQEFL